ncbi:C40 family peptidase [Nocardia bhagyanarayanae]|uniref:C40 family peptidase n=1 Tax=Nocardia bhagyanarayanae TaxID=1215925 RepID=UPI001FEBE6A2|nr:C40 family peptidase [Nocardia bhagyanarayanae]
MTALLAPVVLMVALLMAVAVRPEGSDCSSPVRGDESGMSGATGHLVAGLSERQLQLARDGVAIGKRRGMPAAVIISELAAQATESTFRNLANPVVPESLNYPHDGLGYDHDSVGPHQMRYSVWGSVGIAALMNSDYQINWFYDKTEALGADAREMSPTALAQEIERSTYPDAYARHLDLARQLYARFADLDVGPIPDDREPTEPRPDERPVITGCSSPTTPPDIVPASDFGLAVIAHAQRWMGTSYVWGGGDIHGPTNGGFDCSGLTLYAIYHASGGQIRLPHYTQAQQDHPTARPVPNEQRAPGDLIFFTYPGDTDSHHVGVYTGRDEHGTEMLLHAPQTGQVVTLTPLSAWDGERMDVRRYGGTNSRGDSDAV